MCADGTFRIIPEGSRVCVNMHGDCRFLCTYHVICRCVICVIPRPPGTAVHRCSPEQPGLPQWLLRLGQVVQQRCCCVPMLRRGCAALLRLRGPQGAGFVDASVQRSAWATALVVRGGDRAKLPETGSMHARAVWDFRASRCVVAACMCDCVWGCHWGG